MFLDFQWFRFPLTLLIHDSKQKLRKKPWGLPGGAAVKCARSALAAWGSLVRIPGTDMALLGKPSCGRRPKCKVEEDGHRCWLGASLPQQTSKKKKSAEIAENKQTKSHNSFCPFLTWSIYTTTVAIKPDGNCSENHCLIAISPQKPKQGCVAPSRRS